MTTFLSNLQDSITTLFTLLRLSLTSSDFYKDVLTKFSGYGIKFIFILIYFSTISSSLILLIKLAPLKEYTESNNPKSNSISMLDNAIKNWETFYYDGKFIKSNSQEPIIIRALNNKPIIAIDSNDSLSGSIKKDIPVVFSKSKLLVGLGDPDNGGHIVALDYQSILGDQRLTINSDYVQKAIKDYANYSGRIIIFVLTPIMILLNLALLFFEKLLMIIIIFASLKLLLGININIQSSIRVVLFSCGLSALLMPFSLFSTTIGLISNISQFWTSILIIFAIMSIKDQKLHKL